LARDFVSNIAKTHNFDWRSSSLVFPESAGGESEALIRVPGEIVLNDIAESGSEAAMADLREALTQMEAASAAAVDLMYEKRDQIEDFSTLEKKILNLSNQWIQRRAGLRAPTLDLESLESE
jgi:hypothetical protein